MRLPTWYKLTSLSLYLSQLKHTLMSAMMSNKSCQRIKLNILLKTRVIWKFVFFWVSLWRPVSGHNQGTKALCGVRGGLGSFSGHHGLSLPSQGRHALKVYKRSSELYYCLSKLVVWKLRTFRMQPTRNNTRLQNPAGSVGGVLHGPLSRRVALGGNRCHYWHFQHYNYSSPFQQGEEVHKSNFSIIKILKSD